MRGFSTLFLLTAGLFLVARPTLAATSYAVGTCEPTLQSYSTISEAVADVPPGSIVEVCPGSYVEQVIIRQPLTLKGVRSGNAEQAVLMVPFMTPLTTVTDIQGNTIAPQLSVAAGSGGPVNINDITVDGSANTVGQGTYLVGIYYESGSSGTINGVTVRNLSNSTWTFAILVENGTATHKTVTIENNNIHTVDADGITFITNQKPSSLTVNVTGNKVANIGGSGITASATATISGNVIVNALAGIVSQFNYSASIESNTVSSTNTGILVQGVSDVVESNTILNSSNKGIWIDTTGATIEYNTITYSGADGIYFNCGPGNTVSSNIINDAPVGLASVPADFSGSNTFDNVLTVKTGGC